MAQETPATEQPQEVTSASFFKQRASERTNGTMLELPSGAVVRCGRPKVSKLIADGNIPQDVAAVLFNRTPNEQSQRVNPAEFPKLYEFQRKIAQNSVLEPIVVDGEADYDAGEISIDDFDDQDLSFITQYVQSGNKDLAFFRGERAGDSA